MAELNLITDAERAAHWQGVAERALAKQVEMEREHAEASKALVEVLQFIVEHIAQPGMHKGDLYSVFGLNAGKAVAMSQAALRRALGQEG